MRRVAPRQNCPRCEAEQSFPVRHRPSPQGGNLIVVYIACTVCGWNRFLRTSTEQIEQWIKAEAILKRRAEVETARHFAPSASTRRMLRVVSTNIATARARDIPHDDQRTDLGRSA